VANTGRRQGRDSSSTRCRASRDSPDDTSFLLLREQPADDLITVENQLPVRARAYVWQSCGKVTMPNAPVRAAYKLCYFADCEGRAKRVAGIRCGQCLG